MTSPDIKKQLLDVMLKIRMAEEKIVEVYAKEQQMRTPTHLSIGQEAVVVNPDCGYAGTIDAIARIDGRKYAIDFKTSKSIREFEFRLQVEAYRRAAFIGLVADGQRLMSMG